MLLSNEYRPDPRVEKEAEALVDSGAMVTVLAWDRLRSRPQSEQRKGVDVVRVQTRSVNSKSGLLLNYPIFIVRSIRKASSIDADVVHAHDLDTLLIGVILNRIKNVPLVYDAHEHYSKMVANDLPEFVCRFLDRFESSLARKADRVIAANVKIAEYLDPHLQKNAVVVMNCIDLLDVSRNSPERNETVVFYGGALEPLRYIIEILQACKKMDNVSVRIAGTGTLEPKIKEMSEKSKNVSLLGYLPKERIMEEIGGADLVIALLDPSNENNVIGTPNRLFEAMAVGTPVLVSTGTLSGSIVEEERCGYAIQWSEGEFRRIIAELSVAGVRDMLGENGRNAVRGRYNWGIMKKRLLDLYESL
jgi:glycosyltransferase involved in cell wall biosynthesis